MKIGIITFQDTTNYGALLQAVGLQMAIREIGFECETIDYECDNIAKREMPPSIFSEGVARIPILAACKIIGTIKYKRMEQFKKSFLKLSSKKYNRKNISDTNDVYDCFIAGSDIIWELNVTGRDTTFYLDFVREKSKRNAFSASFGYNEIPNEYTEMTKSLINGFNRISTRENEGAEIIEKLCGKNVPVTLDPTLLVTAENWRKYEKKYNVKKPYVLVYFDDAEHHVMNYAKKIALKNNLDVIFVSNALRGIPNVKMARSLFVEQFLWLIDNAEYVVTSSYHGVVFAINFNTPFYFFNRAHFGRISTIVSKTGIDHRNISDKDCGEGEIDWNNVNEKLDSLRRDSIQKLKQIISNKNEETIYE